MCIVKGPICDRTRLECADFMMWPVLLVMLGSRENGSQIV